MIRPLETRPAQPDKYRLPTKCSFCDRKATTEAFFQLENCLVVQKYCDECLPDAEYEIPS
jgi:hypothetical protein